jgi:hypothetical protein
LVEVAYLLGAQTRALPRGLCVLYLALLPGSHELPDPLAIGLG